jgi:polysaccharide export outer membrane protein
MTQRTFFPGAGLPGARSFGLLCSAPIYLVLLGGFLFAQPPVAPAPQQPGAPLPQQNGMPAPQQPGGPQQLGAQAPNAAVTPQIPTQLDQLRPNYVLRPGDQILIRAFEVEEISERPFRIDGDGFINLPIVGKIQAGGLSVDMLEAALIEALRKYVRVPQVTITVVQFSTEPVFFVGAFKAPGIYPLGGRRNLVEMVSGVGGLLPTASRRIKVTRRKEYGAIPLPNAVVAPDGSGTSIEVNMASLENNVNPAEDIILQPFDVISVERAEMVYVTGEVARVGGLDLQEKSSISVIQALALAGGISQTANPKVAWILRPVMNTSRRALITLDLDRIMKAEDHDMPLLPNDILFVPKAALLKRNLGRTLQIAAPMALGVTALIITLTR